MWEVNDKNSKWLKKPAQEKKFNDASALWTKEEESKSSVNKKTLNDIKAKDVVLKKFDTKKVL